MSAGRDPLANAVRIASRPPRLLQDCDGGAGLSKALASKPDAMRHARDRMES